VESNAYESLDNITELTYHRKMKKIISLVKLVISIFLFTVLSSCGLSDLIYIRGIRTPIIGREATDRELVMVAFAKSMNRPDLCLKVDSNVFYLGGANGGGQWDVGIEMTRSECILSFARSGFLSDIEMCSHVNQKASLLFRRGNENEDECRRIVSAKKIYSIPYDGYWEDKLHMLNLSEVDFRNICLELPQEKLDEAQKKCLKASSWDDCMLMHLYPPEGMQPFSKQKLCSNFIRFESGDSKPIVITPAFIGFSVDASTFLTSKEGQPFLNKIILKLPK